MVGVHKTVTNKLKMVDKVVTLKLMRKTRLNFMGFQHLHLT